MSSRAFRLATRHELLNLAVVALYAASFLLRRGDSGNHRWPVEMGLAVTAFLLLGVAGWLGRRLAYEHRVGVLESPAEAPVSEGVAPQEKAG